jgi:predicted transcriptional regulator
MTIRTPIQPEDTRAWSATAQDAGTPVVGYDAELKAAIEEGREDARSGRVKPADQVWKELGLE